MWNPYEHAQWEWAYTLVCFVGVFISSVVFYPTESDSSLYPSTVLLAVFLPLFPYHADAEAADVGFVLNPRPCSQ